MYYLLNQVFLIEVNTSPALFRAGKYLQELLPKVIEEVVQKTVDVALPPPEGFAVATEPLDGFERLELVGMQSASNGNAHASGKNAMLSRSSSSAASAIRHSTSDRWKP